MIIYKGSTTLCLIASQVKKGKCKKERPKNKCPSRSLPHKPQKQNKSGSKSGRVPQTMHFDSATYGVSRSVLQIAMPNYLKPKRCQVVPLLGVCWPAQGPAQSASYQLHVHVDVPACPSIFARYSFSVGFKLEFGLSVLSLVSATRSDNAQSNGGQMLSSGLRCAAFSSFRRRPAFRLLPALNNRQWP